MAKLAQSFAKYVIHAKLETSGIVEKPDVIGAVFGQTEGLLGTDLDLRELQKTGRIGRIEVDIHSRNGKAEGTITIPSSLDMSETALIASSLETIDKIGPCDATISVNMVEDVRGQKRKFMIDRAKEILKVMMDSSGDESQDISEMIKQAVRTCEISTHEGLSCGSGILDYDEIIIVEGRADVINLLKNGIKNVIAIEGSTVPRAIVDLSREKVVTAFLDGDRGGDLNLKKLFEIAEIDYVARAPENKEVEDLTKKEIYKALREKVPSKQVRKEIGPMNQQQVNRFINGRKGPDSAEVTDSMRRYLKELVGSKAVYLINSDMKTLGKVPLSELGTMINNFGNIYAIAFDGAINQAIIDLAITRKIRYVAGMKFKERVKTNGVKVFSADKLNI